jgi:EAL domain-containing protein (putative c-di-GMP-specific phosphodiesterase class I)
MRTSVIERLDLESALHWAVERDELELHWQPIVELESGALSGVEALLRWRHPQLGLLAPLDFIPLAEELGLIVPIGAWVLGQACAEHARWASARGDEAAALTVSVNLSPRQLSRDFAREVAEALSASGTDPANVMLEITESIFLRNDRETKAVLESLNGIGVRLAVDDFGVGYSSLHTLKQVTASALKIDRSFIAQMHHQVDQAIVRAILGLSEELGLETIAEGVETKGQLDMLRRFGCRAAQGFLFSEPRPTAALEQSFGPGLLVPAS